jgi:transcriptional regulator with XRE-family HTH domain
MFVNARTFARHEEGFKLAIQNHPRLLIKLARLYYEENLTQDEIAERLRLSRQKVQRLLRRALKDGIVQITIRPITGIFSDLEKGLEKRYGLREALVVETTAYDYEPTVARDVGAGAAEYLTRVLQPHDRIVISWGGTLLPMVDAMSVGPPLEVADIAVIQGLGDWAIPIMTPTQPNSPVDWQEPFMPRHFFFPPRASPQVERPATRSIVIPKLNPLYSGGAPPLWPLLELAHRGRIPSSSGRARSSPGRNLRN